MQICAISLKFTTSTKPRHFLQSRAACLWLLEHGRISEAGKWRVAYEIHASPVPPAHPANPKFLSHLGICWVNRVLQVFKAADLRFEGRDNH